MKQKAWLVLGLGFLIIIFTFQPLPFNVLAQTKTPTNEPPGTSPSVTLSDGVSHNASAPVFSEELKKAFELVDSANIEEIDAKVDDAVRAAERTLKQREKDLGPEDRLVAESLLTLGLLYLAEREFVKADKPLKRARAIYEKTYGPESVELSYALAASAEYEMERGVDDHAEGWLKRSLEIREKAFGSDHLEVAKAAFSLAEYYQSMRQFARANDLYDRVLAIRAKLVDADDDSIHQVMTRQACIFRKKQKYQEATELEFRAGAGPQPEYERNGKYKHPDPDLLSGKVRRIAATWLSAVVGGLRDDGVWAHIAVSPTGKVIYACSDASAVPSLISYAYERIIVRSTFDPTIKDNKPVMVAGPVMFNVKDESPKAVTGPNFPGKTEMP